MRPKPPYRPQPITVTAPTLHDGAGQLADVAELWQQFTGRG